MGVANTRALSFVVALACGIAVAKERRSPTGQPTDRAIAQGQQLLGELKFAEAAEALKAGVAGTLASRNSIDFDNLKAAYVSLAVAHFRLGEDEAAARSLSEVVRLDPEYQLVDEIYPPAFRRELDDVRRRLEERPRATLVIDGTAGAAVTVNGRPAGKVPLRLEGLIPGRHFVRAEGASGKTPLYAVEVKPPQSSLTLELPRPVIVEAPLAPAAEPSWAPLKPSTAVEPQVRSRVPPWVWVAGGVGLAAAAGGTYYAVTQMGRPVTGTVTARW